MQEKPQERLKKLTETLETAKATPGFLDRAHKLFLLKEEAAEVHDGAVKDIQKTCKDDVERATDPVIARTWWISGLGTAVPAFVGAAAMIGGGAIFLPAAMAVVAGFVIGGGAAFVTSFVVSEKYYARRENELEDAKARFTAISSDVEAELKSMEKGLLSQPPEVRSEFREAFRLAIVKEDARAGRVHRQKVEQDAEETREAAETARTMATVAAVAAATSPLRR